MIICGDMNEIPTNPAILNFKSHFQSAYEVLLGKEPSFTTFKFREKEGYVKRTIDYIFISKGLKVVNGLSLPDVVDEEMGNPCENHPSDHYGLLIGL